MTALHAMRPEVYAAVMPRAIAAYAEDNVAAGRWPAEGALARSQADFDALLPQGQATPDNHFVEILDAPGGRTVGFLWFAVVERHRESSAFVYEIEIEPESRRRGHARAALRALEPIVRSLGLAQIGLHVFGHNAGAQALYRSLGYAVTSLNLSKSLDGGA